MNARNDSREQGRVTVGRLLALLAAGVSLALQPAGVAPAFAASPATAQPPSILFGDLFRQVQERRLFHDSKTFADATPRDDPSAIMQAWRRAKPKDDQTLRAFVQRHFDVPAENLPAPPASTTRPPILEHIASLWPVLTRPPAKAVPGSSLVSLPYPYVVPGGRFRELYYWDSYFTMLGLKRSGRQDLIDAMIGNFGSLIDRFGHIPNGTRTYYLSRSQPPFFYLMTGLSADRSRQAIERRNAWLRAEHAFWMAGEGRLAPGQAYRRVVRLPDGSLLNRYWDDRSVPRDESWREDVEVAKSAPLRRPEAIYRDIRAAAESGWDFSSRWFRDGRTLASIQTTRIVPIDLNSLLYGMERQIAANCRTLADRRCAREFGSRADARRRAIEGHLWNPAGYYADYELDPGRVSSARTAAMAYPLFTGVASVRRARLTAAALQDLIAPGGLLTSLSATGQQWDAPNGWAPLQWIAFSGLRAYGHSTAADRIRSGWLTTVEREYQASGRLVEKYDVQQARSGGGGEYMLQDGFGWTNGVVAELMAH